MYDKDPLLNPEKFGEYHKTPGESPDDNPDEDSPENPESTSIDPWTKAMTDEDTPTFAGEWGYGPANNTTPTSPELEPNSELSDTEALSGASLLTSYGFDTACRIYGLGTVIRTLVEVDETDQNSDNPLGDAYRRLAPNPHDREFLYREIRKDQVRNNQHNQDPNLSDADDPRIGFTYSGDFYDKAPHDPNTQTSVDAIRALRELIQILETSDRFASLRERAAKRGLSPIEYLVGDQDNPVLTDLFNRIGTEISEDQAEQIVTELEEQINPEPETESSQDSQPAPETTADDDVASVTNTPQTLSETDF